MKKISCLVIIFIFLLVCFSPAFSETLDQAQAKVDFYQKKLNSSKASLQQLQKKLQTASKTKKKNKKTKKRIADLKSKVSKSKKSVTALEGELATWQQQVDQITAQQEADAQKAAAELAQQKAAAAAAAATLEVLPIAPVVKTVPEKPYILQAGFAGGGGLVSLGAIQPITTDTNFRLLGGYGQGADYNFIVGSIGFEKKGIVPPDYSGVFSLDFANYSEAVGGIAGLNNLEKGGHFGVGIGLIRRMGIWQAQLGYSSVLGFTAGAGVTF